MTAQTVLQTLRETRLERGLKQAELANKLGIGQSQISDLERAAVDPRLSTVQDVARVLDLELMLVPRQLIPVIDGLVRRKAVSSEERPIYALDGDTVHDDMEVR